MQAPFDFGVNETFTVSGVLRATAQNPEHGRHQQGKINLIAPTLRVTPFYSEPLIESLNLSMEHAVREFDQRQTKLSDTAEQVKTVDKDKWLANAKNMKWYGPFKFTDDDYIFQTATPAGFEGYMIEINLAQKVINLSLVESIALLTKLA